MSDRTRRFTATLATLALLAIVAAPVSAGRPERAFAPAGDIVVSGICAFDVLIETVVNKEYTTTHVDRAGNPTRTHVSGRLVQRISRVGSDTSIVLNVSGPGRFVDGSDGLVVDTHGRWLLFLAGELFLLSGQACDVLVGLVGQRHLHDPGVVA